MNSIPAGTAPRSTYLLRYATQAHCRFSGFLMCKEFLNQMLTINAMRGLRVSKPVSYRCYLDNGNGAVEFMVEHNTTKLGKLYCDRCYSTNQLYYFFFIHATRDAPSPTLSRSGSDESIDMSSKDALMSTYVATEDNVIFMTRL